MKSIPALLTKLTLRAWPFLLIGTILLSLASVPRALHLFKNISTDPIDLLPREHPNVQSLTKIRKKLGKYARAWIVMESEDPQATIRFVTDIASRLREHPDVGKVVDRKAGYDFFNQNKLLYLDLTDLETIRERIDRSIQREKLKGLLVGFGDDDELSFSDLENKYKNRYPDDVRKAYNSSPDGKIFSIYVESKENNTGLTTGSQFQDEMAEFINSLSPISYHPTMRVYLSGTSGATEYRTLVRDLKRVGLISAFLLFLPLLIRFRNPTHVATIFLPMALAMPIVFTVASFHIDNLNAITSFLFAILGGLGAENGIHIFSRYREQRIQGRNIQDAIEEVFEHTGKAILASVAAVAITFLLFINNEFRGFSEFGFIAGLGLWVIFGTYFTLLPSLLILLEKTGLLNIGGSISDKLAIEPTLYTSRSFVKIVLILSIIFSVGSLAAAPFIKFEYDTRKTQGLTPEARIAKEKQRLTTRRINNPAAAIITSEKEAKDFRASVEQMKNDDTLTPTIEAVRSYYDLIPQDQTKKQTLIKDIQKLLEFPSAQLVKGDRKQKIDKFKEVLAQTEFVKEENLPRDVVEIFRGKGGESDGLIYINALPDLDLVDGRNAIHFADDVATISTKDGTYHPSSDEVIYGLMLKSMLANSKSIVILAIFSVSFFVYLSFLNIKKSVIAVASLLSGALWLLGVMTLFNLKLNFYNIIILPAILGISIDNSIHICHRYYEMGRGSITRVIATAGTASLLASLTNASGFVALLFCSHRGLYSIGQIATIGICACLFSTLVFLPALLIFIEYLQDNRTVSRSCAN